MRLLLIAFNILSVISQRLHAYSYLSSISIIPDLESSKRHQMHKRWEYVSTFSMPKRRFLFCKKPSKVTKFHMSVSKRYKLEILHHRRKVAFEDLKTIDVCKGQ